MDMLFVNADILARQLDSDNMEAVSYKAATLAGKLRSQLLRSGSSFCFETVFSHPSKIDFLAEAKSYSYEIILIYIHLFSDELNQARVAQRVLQGGHNVPASKIISRIPRTMRYIRQALPLVDIAQFYDNSSQSRPFVQIALLKNRKLHTQIDVLPNWADEILIDYV